MVRRAPRNFGFAVTCHSFELPDLNGIELMHKLDKHRLESQFKAGPYTFCYKASLKQAEPGYLGVVIHRVYEAEEATLDAADYPEAAEYAAPALTCFQLFVRAGGTEHEVLPTRKRLGRGSDPRREVGGTLGGVRVCPLEHLRQLEEDGHRISIGVRIAVALPAPQDAKGKSQQMAPFDVASIRTWREPDPSYQAFWGGDDVPFSDCNVRAGDGVVFPCHRVVLSAASPVFKAAFAGGMREAAQQELVVQDAASDVLRLLLQHAYGHAPLDVPLPLLLPLLRLADQYSMEELRDAGKFCLMAADLSGAALASLLPQARALKLPDMAGFLAGRVVFDLETWQAAEHSGLLGTWQLADAVLLLEQGKGGFLAFWAALAWEQQATAAAAVGAAGAGSSRAAASMEEAADALNLSEATEAAAGVAAGAAGAAPAAAAGAVAREAAAAGAAAEAEQLVELVEPHSKRRRITTLDSPAAFDTKAAWAALLPLIRFKEGFTEQQLIEARALPGADGVPGLAQALLEAWEAKAKRRIGFAGAAAAAAAAAAIRA